MELNQLKYFEAVARHENISKAAEELYVTRPAISRSLRHLQEELGVKLFDYEGSNRIVLNRAGKDFLKQVKISLMALENGIQMIQDTISDETGEIYFSSPNETIFQNDLLRTYMLEHPKIRLHHRLLSQSEAIEHVQSRVLDFAIVYDEPDRRVFDWKELAMEQLLLLSRDKPDFHGKRGADLREFSDSMFALNATGTDDRAVAIYMCRQVGFQPQFVFEAPSPDIIRDLIVRNNVVSFIPLHMSLSVRGSLGKISPLDSETEPCESPIESPDCTYPIGLVTLKDHYIPRHIRDFIDYLEAGFDDMYTELWARYDRIFPPV